MSSKELNEMLVAEALMKLHELEAVRAHVYNLLVSASFDGPAKAAAQSALLREDYPEAKKILMGVLNKKEVVMR